MVTYTLLSQSQYEQSMLTSRIGTTSVYLNIQSYLDARIPQMSTMQISIVSQSCDASQKQKMVAGTIQCVDKCNFTEVYMLSVF